MVAYTRSFIYRLMLDESVIDIAFLKFTPQVKESGNRLNTYGKPDSIFQLSARAIS